MAQYVRVTEDESLPAIELPTESDGAILLSTLQAQFPGACGLRYKNPETDSWRGIRLLDNMLCPPADEGWGCHLYVVVQKNGEWFGGIFLFKFPLSVSLVLISRRPTCDVVAGCNWKYSAISSFGSSAWIKFARNANLMDASWNGKRSFRLLSVRLRLESIRLRSIWQSAYVLMLSLTQINRRVNIPRSKKDVVCVRIFLVLKKAPRNRSIELQQLLFEFEFTKPSTNQIDWLRYGTSSR